MSRNKLFLFAAAASLVSMTSTAQAQIAFSGSGSSGTLAAPSEGWSFNYATSGGVNNWGSPGVGAGTDIYGQAVAAYGMDLTFTGGGTINLASVLTGNGAGCTGSTGGGTTFCAYNGSTYSIWEAAITGPSSISFRAQNPAFFLNPGRNYFVNVFFDGATPTGFTGSWITSFQPSAVPEPSTWAMMLLGFGAVGFALRRRKRSGVALPQAA